MEDIWGEEKRATNWLDEDTIEYYKAKIKPMKVKIVMESAS